MSYMKKILLTILITLVCLPAFSQQCYWVFFADKQGVSFDPYAYFDAKAVERYQQCGADLYDITNYPVNSSYVGHVDELAIEEVGTSRWFNAVAVMATPGQIAQIEQLPFVVRTQAIQSDMMLAGMPQVQSPEGKKPSGKPSLTDQLIRMQGELFRQNGFDGTGMRIAVLDGGFPRVNTHKAFLHLRQNNRILDTWNFPNKKAEVYGWNSHGLSTLSCITGIVDTMQLGLATGAQFLLYRTEIETEPFKEEVWWQMAMERADQHGANIISSSLGYGKERYWTKDMDGTSYVAKAANLAARKGILVCCSAGNEADTKQWKTIVTPSDADSVLCIGGTTSSLTSYRHIYFSSFGPAADGTPKPNVSAFGHAIAATNGGDDKTDWVYGTSFSCPLVAGFAACAWQAMPGKTAMEMFQLIQQSADLYPYYDYAFGYGVPQASFFINKLKGVKDDTKPTFEFRDNQDYIDIHPLADDSDAYFFFNKQLPNGTLVQYSLTGESVMTTEDCFRFHKGMLDSCTLNVWYKGYTASYRLSDRDFRRMVWEKRPFEAVMIFGDTANLEKIYYDYSRTPEDLIPSKWGSCARWSPDFYMMFGTNIKTESSERDILAWSPDFRIGGRVMRAFGKAYKLGLGLDFGTSRYSFEPGSTTALDNMLSVPSTGLSKSQYRHNEFALEFFQRIRFTPGGMMGKGICWDLGAYASYGWDTYLLKYSEMPYTTSAKFKYRNPSHVDLYNFNVGITTRLSYDWIGLYARYRLTGLTTCYDLNPDSPTAWFLRLPRLEVGLQFSF